MGGLVGRSVGQSVARLVGWSVGQSVGRSVGWSVSQSVGQSVSLSVGMSVGRSLTVCLSVVVVVIAKKNSSIIGENLPPLDLEEVQAEVGEAWGPRAGDSQKMGEMQETRRLPWGASRGLQGQGPSGWLGS